MKKTKDRVIAIDYFRGICILVILLSHSYIFSQPFTYLSGVGNLWTSAAEMFFLLSGITLTLVRGNKIRDNFRQIVKKSWKRSALLYYIHIFMVSVSIVMAYIFVSNNLTNNIAGSIPSMSGASLLWRILNLSYTFGWTAFLMYYAVFMLIAPFALYILKTRFWATVPLLSTAIYTANFYISNHPNSLFNLTSGAYSYFACWQLYFFIGLTLANFRLPILDWFFSLPRWVIKLASRATILTAVSVLAVSALINYHFLGIINRLVDGGWLPFKVRSFYFHILNHKPALDNLFMDGRAGLLRPVIALLALMALYVAYQRHKEFLLARSGEFVNTMGQNTLWVFVAQGVAIPLLAALPVPRNLLTNTIMTGTLIYLMWLVAIRQRLLLSTKQYIGELKTSYYEAKNSYLVESREDA